MVEVFKTNVINICDAQKITDQIHADFVNYEANFDLDDCDRILRVKCLNGFVSSTEIITIVRMNGFDATVLPDDIEPTIGKNFDASFERIIN